VQRSALRPWHEDEANLAEVVSELEAIGTRVAHRRADLTNVPGADAVIDALADELGGIDAFVANAATARSTPVSGDDATVPTAAAAAA
jgi:NAD(P)-dependent dehydrogenase (short-subunit alcohol dehydrogenase family)